MDGDEYSVIWDDQLLFDHNEEPMDFSKLVRAPDVLEEDEVVSFFPLCTSLLMEVTEN